MCCHYMEVKVTIAVLIKGLEELLHKPLCVLRWHHVVVEAHHLVIIIIIIIIIITSSRCY